MEIFIFGAACIALGLLVLAINEVGKELRGIRTVMETHCELEPIPIRAESTYKRKGVEL